MALKDHYCIEDYEMLTDNLERLHKSFSKALDCATNAEFSSKDQILQSVNESLTMDNVDGIKCKKNSAG